MIKCCWGQCTEPATSFCICMDDLYAECEHHRQQFSNFHQKPIAEEEYVLLKTQELLQ